MEWLLVLLAGAVVYWFVVSKKKSRTDSQIQDGEAFSVANATSSKAEPDVNFPNPVIDGEKDNWEGSFWEVVTPRKIDANLDIKYRDGAGSVTRRTIRLMKYGPWEGGAMLWAYCDLRKANRTFRTDRIVECADVDTGEVVGNLEEWLNAKYEQSPERALEIVVESCWDVLRVLYYISKADGRLTKKERSVVRDAVRSMTNHPAIDDSRIDAMFDAVGGLSLTAFKQAFGRLVNQQRDMAIQAAKWASELVATEKTISPGEHEALQYMKERLNSAK